MKKLVREKLDFKRGLEPKKSLGIGMTPDKQREYVLEKLIEMDIIDPADKFSPNVKVSRHGDSESSHVLNDHGFLGQSIGGKTGSTYYLTQNDESGLWDMIDPWEGEYSIFSGDYREALKFIADHKIANKKKNISTARKTIKALESDIEKTENIKATI